MSDFDQDLKQSLATQASRVPQGYDLGNAAIIRARSIKRRRRVVGVAALAAVVAIAIPVGLQVGDAAPRGDGPIEPAMITGPTRIDIDLASLPLGEVPSIPYVDGRTVVVGDERYEVDVEGDITAAAAFDGGAHLYVSRDGVAELVRITPNGAEELGAAAATPIASPDLRWNAYAVGEADKFGKVKPGITVVLFDSQDGSTKEHELPLANEAFLQAIVGGTLYFQEAETAETPKFYDPALKVWGAHAKAPYSGTMILPGGYFVTAVSPRGDLVARRVTFAQPFCSEVRTLASGSLWWETCKYSVTGFSPDGSLVWAGPEYRDGYSIGDLAILAGQSGDVIRRLPSFDNGLDFMDATFEDDDHLLIRVEQDGQTALVRCTVSTGECELAVPVADGTSLEVGGSPYLLTE